MEKAIISGVTHDVSEAKLTIQDVPDRPGIAGRVFRVLSDEGINVDMIVQNVSTNGKTDISFTVPREDGLRAKGSIDAVMSEIGAGGILYDDGIGKVSLVGAGMRSHPGVAATMFSALAEAGVNIEMISTSSIRISCVVREADVVAAVRAIHDRFRLSDEVVMRETHPGSV
jgi:aspartate kinase